MNNWNVLSGAAQAVTLKTSHSHPVPCSTTKKNLKIALRTAKEVFFSGPSPRGTISPVILCPTCNNPVSPPDLNIATDVAFCRACNKTFAVSDVVHGVAKQRAIFDKAAPPPGTWLRDDGVETRIGASTRSPIAFFVVPFAAIWSGFSLGMLYGTQITSGKFNLVFSLFGIPFLIASLIIWSMALMLIAGKTEVRLRSGEGVVFSGIGALGWSRRFSVSEITTIREDWSGLRTNRQPRKMIILEGARRITLGTMLNESRRYFLLQSLRSALKINH